MMAALALFGVAWHNKIIPPPTSGDMTRRGLGSLKRAKAVSLFQFLSSRVLRTTPPLPTIARTPAYSACPAYRTRQSEIVRNPSSARFFWPAGLSFRCKSCCVRWDRGGSCAPSVAVCRSLRQWDIRYEEPSGSSACRRSILPTRPPEIASLVQVPTFRILFGLARSRTVPGRQHD